MEDIRNGVCPLCHHNEIVACRPRADHSVLMVMDVSALWGGPENDSGEVHAYFCRRCGKTEFFTMKPGEVPIGDNDGTRLIQGQSTPETPYR